MMNVLILGCGPAGLLATHAVDQAGHNPVILSRKQKSGMDGTQFLHEAIPDLTSAEPDRYITYKVRGDPETYAYKVYGDPNMKHKVSFGGVFNEMTQPAWSLPATYDELWRRYSGRIVDTNSIDSSTLSREFQSGGWDMVFSTIPAPAICYNPSHVFSKGEVWVSDTAIEEVEEGTVVYDGTKERGWYRLSRLWGKEATEWGVNKPPLPGLTSVKKPLGTTCDCWEGYTLVRLGRFGAWTKGILTHHAYREARVALADYETERRSLR